MTTILGINAYHGDSSAALVRDGELVAACEEERYNRIKHWAGFPAESVRRCLKMGGIGRSRNGNDVSSLGETPGKGQLRRGTACLLRDVDHRPEQADVLHQGIPLESRVLVTHVCVMK